jgi:hypothetical protein
MPRELSKAEQEYIRQNHDKMTPEELCEDMPGIGTKTVEKFIETSVMPEVNPDETLQQRQEELQKRTGLTAGKLMGRDPERGVVVMTPGASELADAKRVVNVPSNDKAARAKGDRIHIMDPSKRVR